MTDFTFERPVGAAADAMELEFIAALHQTDEEDGYRNASIDASDVRYYLLSRFGIDETEDEIRRLIFRGLAGGDGEDNCIDIIELVAILLIPYLVKATDKDLTYESKKDKSLFKWEQVALDETNARRKSMMAIHGDIFRDVLKIILTDATGSPEPQLLTKDLLRKIFQHYNESDLVQNEELLDEMIELASNGKKNVMLDVETFTRALTNDVWLYKHRSESTYTTHYEDVFGDEEDSEEDVNNLQLIEEKSKESYMEDPESREADNKPRDVKRIFTFPSIDSMADTYRNRGHFACAWMAFIFGYIAYINPFRSNSIRVCKEENSHLYRCMLGQSVVTWIFVMLTMVLLGPPILMSFSLGNNPHGIKIWDILGGFVGIAVFILFPLCHEFDAKFMSTVPVGGPTYSVFIDVVNCILAGALGMYQIININRLLRAKNVQITTPITNSKFVRSLITGSAAKEEMHIKTAAALKIHRLVMNAYELHQSDKDETFKTSESKKGQSTHALALLNFTKVSEKTETTGGFIWGWKQFFTGSLLHNQGIWIHTRSIAANLSQFFVVVIVFILGITEYRRIFDSIYGNPERKELSCNASFNYDSCIFGGYNGMSFCTDMQFLDASCMNNFEPLEGPVKDIFCSMFENIATTTIDGGFLGALPVALPDIPDLSYFSSCPEVYISHPDIIKAYSVESDDNNYCRAPLTACIRRGGYGEHEEGKQLGMCLVGMTDFMPYQFEGSLCSNYEEIQKIVEKKEELGDTYTLMPKKWMLNLSASFGFMAAFAIGLYNASVTIPSYITTVLQFRSGVLPSLRTGDFNLLRNNMYQTSLLLGTTVWSSLLMSFAIIAAVSGAVFLLVWQVTRGYLLSFTAFLFGILLTLVFKIVLTIFLGKYNFAAFYRKYPAASNVVNVAFECWHLALTSGYVVARAIKLIIISIGFIGRFDKPILAPGVGQIGNIHLDNFPLVFRKDILLTEAHRHPYIERLGLMYMMKLRFGDDFAKKSGSTWRLLFVFALMPWLSKYRIADVNLDEEEELIDDMAVQKMSKISHRGGPKSIARMEAENNALRAQLASVRKSIVTVEVDNDNDNDGGSLSSSFISLVKSTSYLKKT